MVTSLPGRRASILALFALTGLSLLQIAAIQRGGGDLDRVALIGSVLVLHVAFVAIWLNQGLLPALVASALVIAGNHPQAGNAAQCHWAVTELVFCATVGWVLLTWSALGENRFAWPFWLLAGLAGLALLTTLLANVVTVSVWTEGMPPAQLGVDMKRATLLTALLFVVGGFLALWRAGRGGKVPRSALGAAAAATLLAPAVAVALVTSFTGATSGDLLHGAQWSNFPEQFRDWVDRGGYTEAIEHGGIGPTSLVLAATILGLWRAVARGFRQRRRGRMPLAWSLAICSFASLLFVPLNTSNAAPLALIFLTAVLPVFGLVDLLFVLGEAISLRTPEAD